MGKAVTGCAGLFIVLKWENQMKLGADRGTFKGYFLVRDKNGKPRFDDIFNIADEFWNELTKDEQEIILQERKDNGGYSLSGN